MGIVQAILHAVLPTSLVEPVLPVAIDGQLPHLFSTSLVDFVLSAAIDEQMQHPLATAASSFQLQAFEEKILCRFERAVSYAALASSPSENLPSVPTAHSRPESVLPFPLDITWLISSFHGLPNVLNVLAPEGPKIFN